MVLIAALLAAVVVYIVSMRKSYTRVSTNPNFGVTTRVAAMEVLERRRGGGGKAVIAFDVAGMRDANQLHGEQWVNERIKAALDAVRKNLRTTDVIAQLNSGDEFFIVINRGDEVSVMTKVVEAFQEHWPNGVYIASSIVKGDVLAAVNAAMENVYSIKAVVKSKK